MNDSLQVEPGILFIVSTPIGNLEDITIRALKILREVDFICCEDTRHTRKLLQRYRISKPLISYFEHNELRRIPSIMRSLEMGKKAALVSDAGTPGISDPGFPLIREAVERHIKVIPIPGPCAATAAISAAGLPFHRFLFLGFPPPKSGALKILLSSLAEETATLIFYVPPRKLTSFLPAVQRALGNRRIAIARELTKIHEEFIRGPVEELIQKAGSIQIKGEATVLIEGKIRKKSS